MKLVKCIVCGETWHDEVGAFGRDYCSQKCRNEARAAFDEEPTPHFLESLRRDYDDYAGYDE